VSLYETGLQRERHQRIRFGESVSHKRCICIVSSWIPVPGNLNRNSQGHFLRLEFYSYKDAADEEHEDLALGELFDSVVTAVGAEAEGLVVEIDDAASDADALAVAEARIEAGLGLEQRAPRSLRAC